MTDRNDDSGSHDLGNAATAGGRRMADMSAPDDVWTYQSADGRPVFSVLQGEGEDSDKGYAEVWYYRGERPGDVRDPNVSPLRAGLVFGVTSKTSRASHSLPPMPRPPYRLPELLAASPSSTVFITEGERDADNLQLLGLIATCVAGSATGASDHEWGEALAGKNVVVVTDADQRGLQRGSQIVKSIEALPNDAQPESISALPIETVMRNPRPHSDATDLLDIIAREQGVEDDWHTMSETTVSPDWAVQLKDHHTATEPPILGHLSVSDWGPAMDEGAVARMRDAFKRYSDRAMEVDEWKLYCCNELILAREKRRGGRLHNYIRMSQGLSGGPEAQRVYNASGENHKVSFTLDKLKVELRDVRGLWRQGARGLVAVNLAEYFWDHPATPRYVFEIFNPGADREAKLDNGVALNNYVSPHEGPAEVMSPLRNDDANPLRFMLTQNFPLVSDVEVLLDFMANCVQRPAGPLGWSVMFVGTHGCGKGTVKKILHHCCDNGTGNMAELIPADLDGNFNENQRHKTVVSIDEASDAPKALLGRITGPVKMITTEDRIQFNQKNVKSTRSETNHAKVIVFANEDKAMAMIQGGRNDRRCSFLKSCFENKDEAQGIPVEFWEQHHPDILNSAQEAGALQDHHTDNFWRVLYYWLEHGGGYEQCRHYLENWSITNGRGLAPHTSFFDIKVAAGAAAWIKTVIQNIDEGKLGYAGDVICLQFIRADLEANDKVYLPNNTMIAETLHDHGFRKCGQAVLNVEDCLEVTGMVEGSKYCSKKAMFYSKNPAYISAPMARDAWTGAQNNAARIAEEEEIEFQRSKGNTPASVVVSIDEKRM